MNTRQRCGLGCLVTALALVPAIAQAHLLSTGLGPVYDGISHFVLSPEEAFPVVALALFAGLRGPATARYVLFVLPTAWIVGGLGVGFGLSLPEFAAQIVTAAIFLLVGGILVIEAFQIGGVFPRWVRVPPAAAVAIAAFLGVIRGDVDMAGFVPASRMAVAGSVQPLLGVVIAVFVLTALAASFSLPLKAMWSRIAVCVTGSWSAALGLLLVGWSIHLAIVGSH